jgi:hypothetical protein
VDAVLSEAEKFFAAKPSFVPLEAVTRESQPEKPEMAYRLNPAA